MKGESTDQSGRGLRDFTGNCVPIVCGGAIMVGIFAVVLWVGVVKNEDVTLREGVVDGVDGRGGYCPFELCGIAGAGCSNPVACGSG